MASGQEELSPEAGRGLSFLVALTLKAKVWNILEGGATESISSEVWVLSLPI